VGVTTAWLERNAELARDGRVREIFRRVPHRRLADLGEDTLGRVSGTVQQLDSALEAPLSQRACVYYRVTVEKRRGYGRRAVYRPLASEQKCVPFAIADDGARAIIDPIATTFAVGFDLERMLEGTWDTGPREQVLLARHDVKMEDWWDGGLCLREATIEIGKAVAVVGSGVRDPDPTRPPDELYRGQAATLLRLAGSPRFPMIVSNDLAEGAPLRSLD
jgi:hypothetical protein